MKESMVLIFLFFSQLTIVPGIPSRDEIEIDDLAQLQGVWEIEEYEVSGIKSSFPKEQRIVIQGDLYQESSSPDSAPFYVARLKLDSRKSPKVFEWQVIESAHETQIGKAIRRIYKIEGNRFTFRRRLQRRYSFWGPCNVVFGAQNLQICVEKNEGQAIMDGPHPLSRKRENGSHPHFRFLPHN